MFKVAGVSKFKGEVKVRFANDMTRVKVLDKNEHTDINLIELPKAMEKGAVVKFLLTSELMQNTEAKMAIEEADEKYNGAKVVKAAKTAVLKTGGKKVEAKAKAPAAKAPVAAKAKAPVAKAKAPVVAKVKTGTVSKEDALAALKARAEKVVTE
jgi:hypothetical protein